MIVRSVNVGMPREVRHGRRTVSTGIYKNPVEGPVLLGRLGPAGDGQADLEAHGGVHKAVLAYPREHYAHWQAELGRGPFPPGQFGENLTLEGWLEDAVHIGDVFAVGGATLQVSQPRTPCFKLGIRMEAEDFPKRYLASGRSGFYLRVLAEGPVRAGDTCERIAQGQGSMSVRELSRLRHFAPDDREGAARAAALPDLAPALRELFAERLRAG
jgi:MOSC domain-containing protein YiiM